MPEIIQLSGIPKCKQGCVHYVELKGFTGNVYPRCLANLMIMLQDPRNGQTSIDVKECPAYLNGEQVETGKLITEHS